jgi:ribonuclease E
MLIDAAHPEETRVVVTSGTRLEEFDFETSTKKQVKGNIYLAKVTRVEPSLQAAFVDYGGNRHGFLAFSEIHPDYYRIPVSDRSHGQPDPAAGNGYYPTDHGDNGDDGIDDAGVPLATALPETVTVPETAAEDEVTGEDASADLAPAHAAPEPAGEDPGGTTAAAAAAERIDTAPSEIAWVTPAAPPAPGQGDSALVEAAVASAAGDRLAAEGEASAAIATPAEPADAFLDAPVDVAQVDWDRKPETIALRTTDQSLVVAQVAEIAEPPHGDAAEAEGFAAEDLGTDAGEIDGFEQDGRETEDGDADTIGVESVETFGGDEVEDVEEAGAERRRSQPMRHYKIQEVVKRRQIMLVQVAKEERGNKGAALTTYLSLAGRYCVLMPNTNRGGGVSRKITSIADRRRLKDILEELDIPEGMGVIVRTAGAERSKAEIKRDYEYLLRLWNEIRDLTLQSTAPALIYEEGNLIKRSIRDLYARDIDEVLVEGEEGYRTAKAFMRTLMPSHAKRVQPYRDPQVGLFHRFQIESQIDAVHSPVAQLRSGGYVVINQTEALVAIDVNSGRSTRERNIEETATRTNLEAADEIARQLRLRDLAGLIVIDFIDMEEHRNQIAVERRLKEALKNDRARIQVGRISPFGLLEMSRQRLRPSLAETSTQPCPHCGGTGFIRSVESTALYVLRSIEEEGIRRRSAEICIYVPTTVALYILNQKRESLAQIEVRYGVRVLVARDDALIPPAFRLERLRPYGVAEAVPLRPIQASTVAEDEEEDEEIAEVEVEVAASEAAPGQLHVEGASEDERSKRRRRRRRRRGDEARVAPEAGAPEAGAPEDGGAAASAPEDGLAPAPDPGMRPDEADAARDGDSEADRHRRRRGRRGARTRTRRDERTGAPASAPAGAPASAPAVAAVAAQTIEIVATAEDARIAAETEALPPLETWSADSGFETASLAALAGEAIEPEAARDPTSEHADARAMQAAADPTAEAEQGVPFVSETERAFAEADTAAHAGPPADEPAPAEPAPNEPNSVSVEPAFAPPAARVEPMPAEPMPAEPAHFEPAFAQLAAPVEPVHAEPAFARPASEVEPVHAEPAFAQLAAQVEPVHAEPVHAEPAHAEPALAAAARPGEEVLTVTEKPENPRRGWWQRLIQQ